ncbi:myb-like protein D [Octopus sinensis]|uniref:Myb-like protein D n=1 Tax=Octopus sinensis TaxID=2607531 RepID=A0A6P7SYR1_9MOLL|nr:myb-like protein D [Octopus sinensis]
MSNANRENIGNEDNIDIYNSNIHSDINTSNNSSNTNNVRNYDRAIELNDSVNGSINDNTALDNNINYNNDKYTHNNQNSNNMGYLSLNNSTSEDDPPRYICELFHWCSFFLTVPGLEHKEINGLAVNSCKLVKSNVLFYKSQIPATLT